MSGRKTLASALGLAGALLAVGSASGEPSLATRQTQAQQVLAQIRQIDSRLSRAVEAYNLANVKLERIRGDLEENRHQLVVARGNLTRAQRTLSDRVVAIYVSGSENSTLEVLLGARSLEDLIDRIDTINRLSEQDVHVMGEVTTFRAEVERRKAGLEQAQAEQRRVVADRAAQKARIERQLSQRQALYSTIRSEIERMQAAERARQAALAAQARARMPAHSGASDALGVTASAPEGATVAPPQVHGGVVGIALQYLGIPYRWGGSSPSTGFDCSGFVMFVFSQIGVSLPHNAAAQYGYGIPVSKGQLQPGDVVFFDGLGHNGIYVGGGQFVHSPHTGDVVKISSLNDSWYARTYVGARRI